MVDGAALIHPTSWAACHEQRQHRAGTLGTHDDGEPLLPHRDSSSAVGGELGFECLGLTQHVGNPVALEPGREQRIA